MIGESVTLLARVAGTPDRYGNPTYTWPLPGSTIPGVLVAPGKSTEGNEAIRSEVDTALTLYRLPFDVAVWPGDRIIVRGTTWEVPGQPERWSNGTWEPGSVLELQLIEG